MRFLGHPVHVMLIHFPVALWPAHFFLNVFAGWLPTGAASAAGFWLLAAGTGIAWMAAIPGLADAIKIQQEGGARRVRQAVIHGAINGTVLLGFSGMLAMEWSGYPGPPHGFWLLGVEGLLLVGLFAGNYFGGSLVWEQAG